MTDYDVMKRLAAAQPLPRGERMATWCENSWLDALPSQRLWVRLSEYGLLSDLAFVFDDSPQDHAAAATMVRKKAAPLRRCREDRKRLRQKLVEHTNGTTSVVEPETASGLRNENQRLREEVSDLLAGSDADAFLLRQAESRINTLICGSTKLVSALRKYGRHTEVCNSVARRPCNCDIEKGSAEHRDWCRYNTFFRCSCGWNRTLKDMGNLHEF